jgi:hypothetical protein
MSVLNRVFDLRRANCRQFHQSAFEFNLVLDGTTLDDESVLATLGIGERATLRFVKREAPTARVDFMDFAKQCIILDEGDLLMGDS